MDSNSYLPVVQDSSERLSDVKSEILKELKHLDLSLCQFIVEEKSVGIGGYADVFKGSFTLPGRGQVRVAMKRLRFHVKEDIKMLFEKEIYVWQKLRHKNILPLLGYVFDDRTGYPMLVSECMQNGSAWTFVLSHSDCDLMRLVTGIAHGLAYLHNRGIVHSDIKSDNVLVTDSQDAVICDFGLSRMVAASRSLVKLSSAPGGTDLYIAHEMMADPETYNEHSTATDVWAFGMTVYELLARQRPYKGLRPLQIAMAIWKLDLPRLPEVDPPLTSSASGQLLWDICQRCWMPSPHKRGSMASIVEDLQRYDVVAEAGQVLPITETYVDAVLTNYSVSDYLFQRLFQS